MNDNIEKWLNYRYANNELLEEDIKYILKMYNGLYKHKYNEIFKHDFDFYNRYINGEKKKCVRFDYIEDRTLCKNNLVVITKGVVKDKDEIYKMIILKKDYKYKELYCIDLLTEIYFHKLAFKYNDNKNIIIPEIRGYGEINMENDEVIYFYKMPYYKAELNYNIEESYKLADNNTTIIQDNEEYKIFIDFYKHYKEGIMHIQKLSEKNNIYHNDFIQLKYFCDNCDEYIENKKNYTVEGRKEILTEIMKDIKYLQNFNIFIVIDKCIIIDFEASSRICGKKKHMRNTHTTMLELDTE